MQKVPLSEWREELQRRGGLDCRFRCPVCGHEASARDWKALVPELEDPSRAAQECIGRAMPRDQVIPAFHSGPERERHGEPCNYAAFGLFNVCTTIIVKPDGTELGVFAFADG